MRILITGAAGIVGKNLSVYLREVGHQIIAVDIMPLDGIICADLRNETTAFQLIKKYIPDLILHLASIKNLNFCENNKDATRITNYGITETLTRACLEFKTRIIFFSSDYVFGQYDFFWREEDVPCPATQYGIDKADSELLIQNQLSDFAIIRTAQIYGFSGDFVSLVCKTLSSHQTFIAFANLVNCPTWIGDLLAMVKKIIDHGNQGIFHCVGSEAVSRYQYACKIANAFALNTSYIQAKNIDFLTDIRPPIVRLNGAFTYETIGIYPGRLKDNLPLCCSYAMGMM